MTVRIIGLGCRRGCPTRALHDLIDISLAEHGLVLADVSALASIDSKADEAGLLELAEQTGLPLLFFSGAELAGLESQLSHRSQVAFYHTGCYGVAESAALALAGRMSGLPARLIITRRTATSATFALAAPNSL